MSTPVAVPGKVVVVLKEAEALTSTGLFIPEAARKPSTEATVVSSGVADVQEHDVVLLSSEYAGASFSIDGKDYVTVVAEEILGIIE
jgi:co-chaperonin GroES (HSP10)